MKTRDELPECPVATTVQLIGNKWKLLIIRNPAEPEKPPVAVQRIAAGFGGNFPEGIDRQPALYGTGRNHNQDGLCRGSSAGGIRLVGTGGIHAADFRFHAGLGRSV